MCLGCARDAKELVVLLKLGEILNKDARYFRASMPSWRPAWWHVLRTRIARRCVLDGIAAASSPSAAEASAASRPADADAGNFYHGSGKELLARRRLDWGCSLAFSANAFR